MIQPQDQTPQFDLWRTILAAVMVFAGTWIFGQALGRPLLAAVRAVLP